MPTEELQDAYETFHEVVNMTPKELEEWLATDESQSVGISDGEKKDSTSGGESTGHESGRRIVEILHTKKADLSDDDVAQMKRVAGYVHRHLAQRPSKEDLKDSRWRFSLMNWGHDPLKD